MTNFSCITDLIDRVAANKPALSDGRQQLNYDQMRSMAGIMAADLRQRFGQGHCLMLRAEQNVSTVVVLLAVQYSGNTPVPVDPQLPSASLELMRNKCQAAAMLDVATEWQQLASLPETSLFDANPEIPALLIFTSGTTGEPKAVIATHANLLHSVTRIAEYLNYYEHNRTAQVLPLYYSYGLISQLLANLCCGGYVRIIDNAANGLLFAKVVNEEKLSSFCGVPSSYFLLSRIQKMKPIPMPDMQVICSAGAEINLELHRSIKEIFPKAVLFNNYGLTEATPRVSYIRDDDPRFFQGSCGQPMAGLDVKVVDPDSHQPLAEGNTGVLVVKGASITPGYLHDAEKTAAAFTDEGYFISGDLAYLQAGYIYLKGRNDDIFNAGGVKIAPLEIERVLNTLPGVAQAAVTGLMDEARGCLATAFVMLDEELSKQQLVAGLKNELPEEKIPVRYIQVTAFPQTSNGKLQRKQLAVDADYVVRELV